MPPESIPPDDPSDPESIPPDLPSSARQALEIEEILAGARDIEAFGQPLEAFIDEIEAIVRKA